MCGIVGVMGHNGQYPVDYGKIFRQLLIVDTLRGEDSTGVLSLVGKKKLIQIREPYDGYTFVWQKPFFDLMDKHNRQHKFLLGHNRAATVGEVTKETAHPFVFSQVAGVHNGTISSFGDWERKDKDMAQYEVDSQQLYFLINKYGIEAALKETYGSYALVYFDYKTKTLNFIRNNLRPLWFAHTPQGMFWASERDMLEWILRRNNVHNVTYEMLPANDLWSFKIGDTKNPTKTYNVGIKVYQNHAARGSHQHGQRDYDEYMPPVSNRSHLSGIPRLPSATPAADKVREIVSGNTYNTGDINYAKEYSAKVSTTSFESGSYTIHGRLLDAPYKEFRIYGCSGVEYQRWHNKELRVYLKYFNAQRDMFTVRAADVRIVNKLNSERNGELMALGPANVLMPVSELGDILKEGCLCCGKELETKDADKIFWSDDEVPHPICENCIGAWDLFEQERGKQNKLH